MLHRMEILGDLKCTEKFFYTILKNKLIVSKIPNGCKNMYARIKLLYKNRTIFPFEQNAKI